MTLAFIGTPPSGDEVAAIAAALESRTRPTEPAAADAPVWPLAVRHPDLSIDELRDLARTGRHV